MQFNLPNPFGGGEEGGSKQQQESGEEGGGLFGGLFGGGGDDAVPPPSGEGRSQQVPNPWKLPILDESLPDPVYDRESPYLGRTSFGFVTEAEKLNGRAAMMGFVILFIQELVMGKGVLQAYGLPLDP